jgi:hypothetical protein
MLRLPQAWQAWQASDPLTTLVGRINRTLPHTSASATSSPAGLATATRFGRLRHASGISPTGQLREDRREHVGDVGAKGE